MVFEALFPQRCRGCHCRGTALCAACLGPVGSAEPVPHLATVAAATRYRGVVRAVILDAKYRGRYRSFDAFVPRLAALAERLPDLNAVVAPPSAPEHARARGFDPAGYLAHRVARQLGLGVLAPLVRVGPAQTGRGRAARLVGPALQARRAVRGRILVVDDVLTTGATLTATARALMVGGADTVVGLVAARAAPTGLRS